MSRNSISWAVVARTKFNSLEPSAKYAFSSNFNAPLPEDSEPLCSPDSIGDEDDVADLRAAQSEPGERVPYSAFRRSLEH